MNDEWMDGRSSGMADLRVHLNQVEKDDVFTLNFDGFVKRIFRFGFDHLV